MIPANNETLFGDWSAQKRGGATTWGVLTLLLSLAGNSIILLASIRHKAVQQSKMTVTLIEHVAGSDLGIAIFGILPDVVTLFAFDWRVVEWFCVARFGLQTVFVASSTYLVCALNVCKLFSLKFPLRSRLWTKRFANSLVISIWTFCLVASGAITATVMKFEEMIFDYRINMCMYKVTTNPMKLVGIIQTMLQWTIPNIVVLSSSIWILVIAKRKARMVKRWRWRSVLTILLIAAVYCVSYLPLSSWFTTVNFVLVKGKATIETVNKADETVLVYVEYDMKGDPLSNFGYSTLFLLLVMLTYLGSVANIFIYYVSMTSFQNAIKGFLHLEVKRDQSLNSSMTLKSDSLRNVVNSNPCVAASL